MANSGWRINPVAGCLVCVVALLFAAPLLDYRDECQGGNQSAEQQAQHTPKCLPAFALSDAPIQEPVPNPEPDRDEWREESDLEAQRDMARWAQLMLVVSCIGTAVTAIGVVYVAKTLRAAHDANAVMNVSAERQLRAYVAIESSAVRRIDVVDPGGVPTGSFQIDIGVIFKNTGQTPALDFSGASVSGLTTLEQIQAEVLPDSESAKVIGAGGGVSNSKTRTAIYTNATLATALQAGTTAWFRSRHTYRDIFGVEWELISTLKGFDMQQLMKVQGNTPLSPIKGKNVLRRTDGKSF